MRWAVDLILTKKLWMLLWCTHSYQGRTFNPLISFPQNIDLVDNFCVIIYHVATPATFVFDVVSHTHYIKVVVFAFSVFLSMVVILSIPSSRFRRTPMFSVYPSICLASSGYNSLYSFLFSGYGIQKLSFQGVQVVSHRRGLLEIPLKAKLPIFFKLSSVF